MLARRYSIRYKLVFYDTHPNYAPTNGRRLYPI